MAHKGSVSVATSSLLKLAEERGVQVEQTSGYLVLTKPGVPHQQVLVERFVKKGATDSITRWVELRGKGKTPYVPSSPGVIPHNHSSPSITHRLDTDSSTEKVIEQMGLLLDVLMAGEAKKEEQPVAEESAPVSQAA